ncbi:MAG: MFS transporter [Actinomycetota bacterium]
MRTRGDADRAFGRARAGVTATFATHAIAAGTLGPWIPHLKADARLDDAGLGLALTGFAVGLVAGTRLAGPLLRRAGGRAVVRAGIPALATGLALLPIASGLLTLAGLFAAFGVASGLLDVSMNAEAVAVEESFGRRVMSSMHGAWSVSLLVGAAIASAGIAAGVPLGVHFPATAAVLAAASFPLLRWLPAPREPATDGEPGSNAVDGRTHRRRIAMLCAIGFASFLAEGVAVDWSAVYLRDSVGASAATAGVAVVAFSAGMTISRFAGDRLAMRFPPAMIVRVGTSCGAAALGTALLVGGAAASIAAFAILGLGLGPVVPLAFSAGGTIARARGGSALAIVVTSGYVGSIVGPLTVGLVADRLSLRAAFVVPVLMCAAAAAAAGAIHRRPARAGG